MAKVLGIRAHVFMPKGSAASRVKAIEAEGASVTVVEGSYDMAVERAADLAGETVIVLQDTGYPGYETIPLWIVEGYSTMFWEADDAWKEESVQYPTHVFVQIGVGSLAEAALRYSGVMDDQPVIVGVEPTGAACVLESLKAGKVVTIPGHQNSIMAGLNCGTPSTTSFPQLRDGINCLIAIEDQKAMEAMRLFASAGITAGETGAAGMGGLLEILLPENDEQRSKLGIGRSARILLLNTEGATDPDAYKRIVGTYPR